MTTARLFMLLVMALTAAAVLRPAMFDAQDPVLLKEDSATGLELWQTALGSLWIPRPGKDVIRHLAWEQVTQKVYHHPNVHVRPGDVVIDCGAHIGGFTRVALSAGARMVIAIEPQRGNLLAFEKNLAQELKTGKVKLIRKGVWDSIGKLSLNLSRVGDSHSVVIPQDGPGKETIEVTTLDALVKSLGTTRVDFVKIDIEGAERNALRGARQLLKRWHPRLAIAGYHLDGDPAAISSIVLESFAGYKSLSKDHIDAHGKAGVPKVMFFY